MSRFSVLALIVFLPLARAAHGNTGSEVRAEVRADALVIGSGPIQGRIADPAGTPLARLAVKLIDDTGKLSASTTTDGAGAFALPARKPGNYLLTVGNGLVQGRVTVDARVTDQTVDIDLPRASAEGWSPVFLTPVGSTEADNYVAGSGPLQGVLTNARTAAPIRDAVVRLLAGADGKLLKRVVTDSQGAFHLGEVEAGRYLLAVGKATVTAGVVIEANRPASATMHIATAPELLEADRSARLVWSRRRFVAAQAAGTAVAGSTGAGSGGGGAGSAAKSTGLGTGGSAGGSGGRGDVRLSGSGFGFFNFAGTSTGGSTGSASGTGTTGAAGTRSGVANLNGTKTGSSTDGGTTAGVAVPTGGGLVAPQAQSGFFNRGRRVASSTN